MIHEIIIKENTMIKDILFFKRIKNLKRITLLSGGNGVGKSLLINSILNTSTSTDKQLRIKCDRSTKIYSYINSRDNRRKLLEKRKNNIFTGDF